MNQIKDASSFFVWEDSADSEVDRLLSHPAQELESAVDDQEEDACSCSCDDYTRALDFQDDIIGDQAVRLIGDGRSDQLDGMWRDGGRTRRSGAALEYNSEEEDEEEEDEEEASSNDVSVIRDMNEMEDKVFWDTCMAGGYP